MHKSTSGAHLVCVWAELECSTCRGHLWSWTPSSVPVWAFNSGFGSFSGAGRQIWAEGWRWTPVYVVNSWPKYRLLYIAGKPWMSTFQLNWERGIWVSVAPKNLFRVKGGQNPTASAVLFQPLNLISAQVPQFQSENTWNQRKTHKLIVKSRNVNLTQNLLKTSLKVTRSY